MKNKIIILIFSILICLLLVCSFILGRNSVVIPDVKPEIKKETIKIEKPVPYKVEKIKTEYIYLPKFNDSTTNNTTEEVITQDSTKVSIDIERKIYQDSTFKATISGPKIGNYGPILEDIDIYNTTKTITIEKPIPTFSPYISFGIGKDIIGIGGGVTIKQRVDIGTKYLRTEEQNMFLVEANIRFNK